MTYLSRNGADLYARFRSRALTTAPRYLISTAQHLDFHDQPITLLCPDSRFPKTHHQPNLAADPPRRHYGERYAHNRPPFHSARGLEHHDRAEKRGGTLAGRRDPKEVVGISRTDT